MITLSIKGSVKEGLEGPIKLEINDLTETIQELVEGIQKNLQIKEDLDITVKRLEPLLDDNGDPVEGIL